VPDWKVPEEVNGTLQELREHAWEALGSAPIRRSILGRRRSDELVRLAMNASPEADLCRGFERGLVARRTADHVGRVYGEKCSGVFTTLILSWAISAIVQALINRWLNSRGGKA
jgi:hypothetical protein